MDDAHTGAETSRAHQHPTQRRLAPGAPLPQTQAPFPALGPVHPSQRALTPDLARGLALLGIALANAPFHLTGMDTGPGGRPVVATTTDRLTDSVVGVCIDNRAFPMFTMLFAFGLVVLARRQYAAGVPRARARALLLRRCAWLGAFGLVHLLALFSGDILLTYGLLGLTIVAFWLRSSVRTLAWWGGTCLLAYTAFAALDGFSATASDMAIPGLAAGSYTADLAIRALTAAGFVLAAPVMVVALLPAAVLGILAARYGVLEDPQRHLRLLRRVTLVGFSVSVVGSLPLVAASTQLVSWPTAGDAAAAMLHGLSGLAGAAAFLAGTAWFVATRTQRASAVQTSTADSTADSTAETAPVSGASGAPGTVTGAGTRTVTRAVAEVPSSPPYPVRALVAVGQRSLTCYLLQSVVMVPLLAPWGVGWGVGTGTAVVSVVAVGTYLVTVVVAVVLERAGLPGPAEALLRRLTYGRRASGADAVVSH